MWTAEKEAMPYILPSLSAFSVLIGDRSPTQVLGTTRKQYTMGFRFRSSGCLIWTSYSSFESSWPADFNYLSFGSIP